MSILTQEFPTVNRTEEKKKWAEMKSQSRSLAARLYRLGYKNRAARMMSCGDYLISHTCPKCGAVEITTDNLCRDRICPMCAWRLARKRYSEMMRTIEVMTPTMIENNVHASMLTLTVRNCKLANLNATINAMSKAWHNLSKRVGMKRVIGWARNLEITFNEKTREAHPHFHILLLWYGKTDLSKEFYNYIKEEWSAALSLDYSAIIDHRNAYKMEVDGTQKTIDVATDDFAEIILECSKYSMKSTSIPKMTNEELHVFIMAIKGVRFVSYGKEIKKARQALGFKEDDLSDDIAETTEHKKVCKCGEEMQSLLLEWACGEYIKSPNTFEKRYRREKNQI